METSSSNVANVTSTQFIIKWFDYSTLSWVTCCAETTFIFSLSMLEIDFEIVLSKQYLPQFCAHTATQIAR